MTCNESILNCLLLIAACQKTLNLFPFLNVYVNVISLKNKNYDLTHYLRDASDPSVETHY